MVREVCPPSVALRAKLDAIEQGERLERHALSEVSDERSGSSLTYISYIRSSVNWVSASRLVQKSNDLGAADQ